MAWSLEQICSIAAKYELKNGMYVNLGIGIPTDVANHMPDGVNVLLQSVDFPNEFLCFFANCCVFLSIIL